PLEAWLAELSLPSPAELPAALRAGAKSLKRPTADQLAEARQQARAGMDELSAFLGDGTDADGWKKYLRWSDLVANTDGSRLVNLKTLREIRERFAARHAGLDLAEFVNVRLALESYIVRLSLVEKDAPSVLRKQLEILATGIERGESARPEG